MIYFSLYGIKNVRPHRTEIKITPDDKILIRQYWLEERLNAQMIADEFHVDRTTIIYHLERMHLIIHGRKKIVRLKIQSTRRHKTKPKSYHDYLEEEKNRKKRIVIVKREFPADFTKYGVLTIY